MLIRSHKKTKKGSKCAECRRRHIRCDLTRPSCVNCVQSDRVCSFKDLPESSPEVPIPGLQSGESSSPGDQSSPSNPGSVSAYTGRSQASVCNLVSGGDGPLVNITHLELFHYFTTMPSPYMGAGEGLAELQRRMVIQAAFSTPYLMHETLAFSARRRSIESPFDNAQYYREQATILQTRALTLFSSARQDINQDNCATVFLFSGMLGIHLLADTLHNRGPDLDSFLAPFIDYLTMHRSLQALVMGLWPMLMNTELRPILTWGSEASSSANAEAINQDSPLSILIGEATDISPEAANACLTAAKPLQLALNGNTDPQLQQQRRIKMALAWPLTLTEPYINLLKLQRPEALIILAYYGSLLRHCQALWMVGDSGAYLTGLISASLDPRWNPFLPQVMDDSGGQCNST